MRSFLSEGANFAVFAGFLGVVLGGVATFVYKWVIVPSLNGHIDAKLEPMHETLDKLADMILRNGHQEGKDPSVRDDLSTIKTLIGQHMIVADADHELLAETVKDVAALKAAS